MKTAIATIGMTLLAACGQTDDNFGLLRPAQFSALSVPIDATLEVFAKPGAKQKVGKTHKMEESGSGFSASVRLRPGTYYFWIRFSHDAGGDIGEATLGEYQDLKLDVEARVDATLPVEENQLVSQDFDSDGDAISNLDELLYGFDLGEKDQDITTGPEAERVTIAAGTATMGYQDPNQSTLAERPEHTETLSAFAIDLYEVSNRRYRVCVARNICRPPKAAKRQDYLEDSDHLDLPATGIRFQDAVDFCEKFASTQDVDAFLPTEQQWEFAARGGDGRLYPWNTSQFDLRATPSQDRCNTVNARYYLVSEVAVPCRTDDRNAPALVAVDHFAKGTTGCANLAGSSNNLGPCQMAGNAWEWTDSPFVRYDGQDWPWQDVPGAEQLQVVRGGSADSLDSSLRSTFRAGSDPELTSNPALAPYVGFRCAYDI